MKNFGEKGAWAYPGNAQFFEYHLLSQDRVKLRTSNWQLYSQSPGHWHNTQRGRTSEQHNKRDDASVRLVGTTNPQQIEVMEFELIVAVFGDYIRRIR